MNLDRGNIGSEACSTEGARVVGVQNIPSREERQASVVEDTASVALTTSDQLP